MRRDYHCNRCGILFNDTDDLELTSCPRCGKADQFRTILAAYVDPQPAPKPSVHPAVWSLVLKDMIDRDMVGEAKYGTRLKPFNGRDALIDAYQEALDLAVYLRQQIYERDHASASGVTPGPGSGS